jgi:hypothetical protein
MIRGIKILGMVFFSDPGNDTRQTTSLHGNQM